MTGGLLYVTPRLGEPRGGRAMLSHLHWRCLSELLGERAALHELTPEPVSLSLKLRGAVDGASPAAARALLDRIEQSTVDRVFFNGSNLGRLARAVKQAHPRVEVLTFFHNIETEFFWGAFRDRPTARGLAILIANATAERLAARYSDRRIVLTRRDGDSLRRLFGAGDYDLLPMALDDRWSDASSATPGGYLLFVGGSFYANRAGIGWFAREVAPRVARQTVVIGHGLEDLRGEIEPEFTLVGAVDDLNHWYAAAAAVIAPIFDGSGMKTKVAEALMHGKRVIGTSQAFVGYEDVAGALGKPCGTADDFAGAIAALDAVTPPVFDQALRALYLRHYSFDAAKARFAALLGCDGKQQ